MGNCRGMDSEQKRGPGALLDVKLGVLLQAQGRVHGGVDMGRGSGGSRRDNFHIARGMRNVHSRGSRHLAVLKSKNKKQKQN